MFTEEIDDSYGYMGSNAFPFFEEIIIISANKDDNISCADDMDLNFIKVRTFTEPADALYHLLTNKENRITYSALMLCEYNLGDFDAALLVSLLRLHPLGTLFPVAVIIEPEDSRPLSKFDEEFWITEKENLLALGAFGFLNSPLTVQAIMDIARQALAISAEEEQKHQKTMQAIERANSEIKNHFIKNWKQRLMNFEKSFVRFFYTPAANASFEEIFLVGKQKYYDRLYNQATECFERSSVSESPHKADSLVYLYAIQKEQEHGERGKIYLERAVDAYVDDANWNKVAECAKLFAEEFPDRQNPVYLVLQKHFSRGNYAVVNNIVESAKGILEEDDIASFLLSLNGSKNFPPEITAFINEHKELKQIIYQSNFKETTLDGEEYRKHQERERTLKRLEMQRLARINGEADKFMPKRRERSSEKIILNDPKMFSFDFDKDSKKNEPDKYAAAENAPQTENPQQRGLQAENSANPAAQNEKSLAEEFGTGSSQKVEGMPTVMLEGGKGSFLGDIISMAKFTRNLYKKK